MKPKRSFILTFILHNQYTQLTFLGGGGIHKTAEFVAGSIIKMRTKLTSITKKNLICLLGNYNTQQNLKIFIRLKVNNLNTIFCLFFLQRFFTQQVIAYQLTKNQWETMSINGQLLVRVEVDTVFEKPPERQGFCALHGAEKE